MKARTSMTHILIIETRRETETPQNIHKDVYMYTIMKEKMPGEAHDSVFVNSGR